MYDLIIIGGGPAGLSAAVYAARFNLKAIVISELIGGYMMESPQICNYPSYTIINGVELTNNMKEQVKSLNIEMIEEEVVKVEKTKEKEFLVKTKSNKEFKSKTILLAVGTKKRKLNIKGEEDFAGKGISYCATCDGPLFKDKIVAVVGGSNSAAVSALLLSQFAKEVHIFYRKQKLRADPYWTEKIDKAKNIKVHYNMVLEEIKGEKIVKKIKTDDGKEMEVGGVFIEIGSIPSTALPKSLGVKLDDKDCIIVDKTQKTNIDGIYAAGDITTGSNKMRQIVTACAEGAVAAESTYNSLK
ncbi:hypothetical protein CEE44_04195 [Candidatus Woesearchaeota archaeon B3_Woes]|nr:MAG: hypothetical protein CEE44_04195 [Candidatus Woesearchaeota archaeon B3_Woes]